MLGWRLRELNWIKREWFTTLREISLPFHFLTCLPHNVTKSTYGNINHGPENLCYVMLEWFPNLIPFVWIYSRPARKWEGRRETKFLELDISIVFYFDNLRRNICSAQRHFFQAFGGKGLNMSYVIRSYLGIYTLIRCGEGERNM